MDGSEQENKKIVSLEALKSESGFRAVAQVEAYWEALRNASAIPKRSDVDPRGIKAALENTFVLERIAPGMARIRIAGRHVTDLLGMDVRGMPITTLVVPSHRRQLSDALEEVFQRPAICKLDLVSEASIGRPEIDARMILLPLKSDLGDVSRILGCFVARGDIGMTPRRFDIQKADLRAIKAHSAPEHETPIAPSSEKPVRPTFTAPARSSGFESATPRPEAPYLRLVKTDN